MQWTYIVGALIVAGLIVVAVSFLPDDEPPAAPAEPSAVPDIEAPVTPAPTPEPEPPSVTPPSIEPTVAIEIRLPDLHDSDGFVRERLTAYAVPARWLEQDDLVQFFVTLTEGARVGDYPRRYLDFLSPKGRFPVKRIDDQTFLLDRAGYRRFDALVAGLEAVPPDAFVATVSLLEPLLRQAYLGLGEGEVDPLARLAEAARLVAATPVIDGDIELIQPRVMYEYRDPDLEALSPLVKQLLRMGPDNVRRIRTYANAVLAQLETG